MRFRTTVRGEGVEMRGYMDGDMSSLQDLAEYVKPYGWMLIASPADADYDPFKEN